MLGRDMVRVLKYDLKYKIYPQRSSGIFYKNSKKYGFVGGIGRE